MSMSRGECRVCGRDSAVNSDEEIHPHKGRTETGLLVSGRCPGSHRPPKDEPPCGMTCGRWAGRVSWPEPLDPGKAHASTLVCFDPEHRSEAAQWVKSITGHEGVFVEMAVKSRV